MAQPSPGSLNNFRLKKSVFSKAPISRYPRSPGTASLLGPRLQMLPLLPGPLDPNPALPQSIPQPVLAPGGIPSGTYWKGWQMGVWKLVGDPSPSCCRQIPGHSKPCPVRREATLSIPAPLLAQRVREEASPPAQDTSRPQGELSWEPTPWVTGSDLPQLFKALVIRH